MKHPGELGDLPSLQTTHILRVFSNLSLVYFSQYTLSLTHTLILSFPEFLRDFLPIFTCLLRTERNPVQFLNMLLHARVLLDETWKLCDCRRTRKDIYAASLRTFFPYCISWHHDNHCEIFRCIQPRCAFPVPSNDR